MRVVMQALLLAIAVSFTPGLVAAQSEVQHGVLTKAPARSPMVLVVPRLRAAPDMDKGLTLLSWIRLGARELDGFTTFLPVAGQKPTVGMETVAYLGYTDDALFIAVECFDAQPAAVQTILAPHDKALGDQVSVLLDTAGSGQAGVELWLNPSGVQGDGSFVEGFGLDASYDLNWQSSANRTASGYIVRFRIPFASVPETGKAWHIRILRNRYRERAYTDTWPRLANGISCTICQSIPMVFDGRTKQAASGAWMLVPAITASRQEHQGEGTLGKPDNRQSLGGDFRFRGASWGLDATYKPDFNAVEADVDPLAVNTRYKTLLPEKRPFFQEGVDIFRGWNLDMISTRSILSPNFGVKMRGEIPGSRWALLATKDVDGGNSIASDGFSDSMRRTTMDIALAWQSIIGGKSAPGRVTVAASGRGLDHISGDPAESFYSGNIGAHYSQYFGQSYYFNGTFIASSAHLPFYAYDTWDVVPETRKGTAASMAAGYWGPEWAVYASNERISPEVRADMGFLALTGYSKVLAGVDREWRKSSGWWSYAVVSLSGSNMRYWGETPLARNAVFRAELTLKHRINISLIHQFSAKEWWDGKEFAVDGTKISLSYSGIAQQLYQVSYGDFKAINYGESAAATQREINVGASGFGDRFRYSLVATQVRVMRAAPGDTTPAIHALRWYSFIEYAIPPLENMFVRIEAQRSIFGIGLPQAMGNPRLSSANDNTSIWLAWKPGVFSSFSIGYTQAATGSRFNQEIRTIKHVTDKGVFLKASYAFGTN